MWVNLGSRGRVGRAFGVELISLSGAIGGAFGTVFVYLLALHLIAGALQQPEPGILPPVLAGAWVLGLFGLVPGAVFGLVFALSDQPNARMVAYAAAIVIAFGCQFAYGLPTNLVMACAYCWGPFAVPWIAMFAARLAKLRLGMFPADQMANEERLLEGHFPD